MYGLVNRAIEAMALQAGGESCWNQIREKAGFNEPTFLSMQPYPDELTYSLVGAASEVLEQPPEAILKAFGRHWILFTAAEGYGPLLDMTGHDLRSFMGNLNHMHNQVTSTMPDMEPPRFCTEEREDGTLLIRYETHRPGLAPMVVGLLEGLIEKFDESYDIVQTAFKDQGDEADLFEVRPREE